MLHLWVSMRTTWSEWGGTRRTGDRRETKAERTSLGDATCRAPTSTFVPAVPPSWCSLFPGIGMSLLKYHHSEKLTPTTHHSLSPSLVSFFSLVLIIIWYIKYLLLILYSFSVCPTRLSSLRARTWSLEYPWCLEHYPASGGHLIRYLQNEWVKAVFLCSWRRFPTEQKSYPRPVLFTLSQVRDKVEAITGLNIQEWFQSIM